MTEQFGAEWLTEEESTEAVTPEPVAEAEPEHQPEPEQPVDAEPVADPDPKHVPVAALQKEREKRQELERELAAFRQTQQPQQPQQVERIPDAYEDPDGFNRYTQGKLAQTEWNLRASMSERFAIKEHGKELVDAATTWALEAAQRDPGLTQVIMADPDPVGLTIEKYQQSRTLESLAGKSFEDAARDHAIRQGWIVSPEAAASPSLKPSASLPPKGLARTPGSGTAAPIVDGFDAVFSDKGMGLRK